MIVVWRITTRCNLSCPFCAYDRRAGGERGDADVNQVLSFGERLAAFQRETGRSVLVSWIGGEPLLWPALEAITLRFVSNFGLAVSTTTNGTTLGVPRVREHLLRHYAELTVSVDGIGERHDRLRGWNRGFASLQQNVSELAREKRCLGRGPLLRVNTVLMRDNIAGFSALCDEVAGWGVDEICFNQLGGRDRPEFFPAHRLSSADIAQLGAALPELRSRLARRGVRLLGGDAYLRRLTASAEGTPLPVHDCGPGESFLFVDERGRIGPCSYTADELGVSVADICLGDRITSLSDRFSQALRRERPRACEDCHATQVWTKFSR